MVRFIGSVNPFRDKAQEYKNKGWTNPIYIPPKSKEPPPVGYTGRSGEEVTQEKLDEWLSSNKTEHANIGLHLGFKVARELLSDNAIGGSSGDQSEIDLCVIGIDVDQNQDNPNKPKHGGEQLKKIERVLGKLPPTWISSSRSDGVSGIRFFLAPSGLEWRGNCSEAGGQHIDIVSKQHKYSVVFPSIHPLGGQYVWYPPGVEPLGIEHLSEFLGPEDWDRIGSGYRVVGGTAIPCVADLPLLPAGWVDFLTRGRLEDQGAYIVDMDSGLKELQQWAKASFIAGTGPWVDRRLGKNGMCKALEDAVTKHLERIESSEERHYPLQDAHWHILSLGAEGHTGWLNALKKVETAWLSRIESELAAGGSASSTIVGPDGRSGYRSMEKAKRERLRSREGALRKLRGKARQMEKDGFAFIAKVETCYIPPLAEMRDLRAKGLIDGQVKRRRDKAAAEVKTIDAEAGEDLGRSMRDDLEDLASGKVAIPGANVADGSATSGVGSTEGGDGEPPVWLKDVSVKDNPDPSEYEPTDRSQAEYFNAVFGQSIRFVSDVRQWIIYDEKTWHIVEEGFAGHLYNYVCLRATKRRALECRKLMAQHITNGGVQADAQYKKLKKAAALCQRSWDKYSNLGPTQAMLKMYASFPGKALGFGQLNPRDDVLAMPNGKVIVLQRRTARGSAVQGATERSSGATGGGAGRVRGSGKRSGGKAGRSGGSDSPVNGLDVWGYRVEDNRKEYLTTMRTKANYVPYSKLVSVEAGRIQVEEWNRTLELILPDLELRHFVQRVFGHLMLGGNDEKRLVFLAGKPHTGKSTLLNSFGVLGDYYGPFNPANVMDKRAGDGSPNPELISLWFKRVIGNSESGMGVLDAAAVKKITGRDEMLTRALYSNKPVSGLIKFAPVMATNKPPTIIGGDSAVVNRLMAIPVENVVSRGVDDKSFTSSVVDRCKYAIWLWLLDGYREYVRLGLDESTWPAALVEKTKGFASEMSDVSSFLSSVCIVAPDEVMDVINKIPNISPGDALRIKLDSWCQLTSRDLYEAYKRWNGDGEKHLKERRFVQEVRGFGIESKQRRMDGKAVRRLHGIKVDHKALAELSNRSVRGI